MLLGKEGQRATQNPTKRGLEWSCQGPKLAWRGIFVWFSPLPVLPAELLGLCSGGAELPKQKDQVCV